MKVSAVVVSHGHARELELLLPMLREQVDELVVVANVPGSVPAGVEAIVNERPLGFAANLNRGFSRASGEGPLAVNPDAVREPGAVAALRELMLDQERCGVAGPRMVYPDGTPQPSRRRFPTVAGTVVRRTPLRRAIPQRRHYHLDEPQPDGPVQCDWMLGGFLLLRRTMLDELGGFDEGVPALRRGHRPPVPRDEGGLGALVRARRGRPPRAPGRDQHELADAPHALARGRNRAVRPQAS
jgi:N-acetylglucosaminyl-diphospho-decaprenol L-rhamnosyltransferase